MIQSIGKLILLLGLFVVALAWNGETDITRGPVVSTAEAVIGRPATPISYAGVARRSPVGVGANTPRNRGGPVNRVGRR